MTGLQFANSRILIFDPNRESSTDTQRALASLGVRHIFTAETMEQALQSIDAVVPDIVLSELLPDAIDGFSLLNRVREMESPACNVPVVILTRAAAKKDLVYQAIERGARGYVLKPCKPLALKKHCMRILHEEGVS